MTRYLFGDLLSTLWEDTEAQVHLFFKCPFARVFWFGYPSQLDVMSVEGEDFLMCWKWLLGKYGEVREGDRLMRGWFMDYGGFESVGITWFLRRLWWSLE